MKVRNFVARNPLLGKSHAHTISEPDDGVEEGILEFYSLLDEQDNDAGDEPASLLLI